tara:strand:+ start:134 stop:418 length:285 start_codon:yes stop_codon:yes gene_type:complete
MKISKKQLRRIIREGLLREAGMAPGIDYGDTPSNPAIKARAQELLAEVALFFMFKDENTAGAAIYNELFRRANNAEHEMLDEALEALALEKGLV